MQSIDFKVIGLRRALNRLWQARASVDRNEAAFALFEVLNWLHSFQDRQLDEIAAGNIRNRGILLGLIGARNAMHHMHFDPIEWRAGGVMWPLTPAAFPLVDHGDGFLEWWWRQGLPEIDRLEQREAYRTCLEGKPVRHTISEVVEMCDQFRSARGEGSAGEAGPQPGGTE